MDKFAQQKPEQSTDGNNFDEVPIGSVAGPHKFMIAEYANGEAPQPIEQSTANMTLQQKLQSKAIKIKLEGLEQLKSALTDQEKSNQIDIDIAKILKQSNPACLERALQCAEKWIEIGRFWGEKQIKEVIENGFINGKGSAKKIANDLLFKTFETKPDEVQRCIVETGLKSKVPKIAGGYFTVINELLQQFGIKDLKYLKPYLPASINVMNNEKLPALKTEGMNVFKNGLKWLGKDFIWPLLSQLKQNMKKELETFWETHDKKQVMKANRQKNEVSAPLKTIGSKLKSKQSEKSSESSLEGGLDIYQISDPIEIFQKFDEKWSESVLETEKWNSKTALLQQIINKASVPKIANSEHRHITEMMRRLINDSNFNVVIAVLKLAGVLAKGLRKNFSHSAKILFPYITPKFRDKKTQMIEETFSTLNNFCYCLSIQEVAEDVKTALKDKAAGMKSSMLRWIASTLEKGSGSDRTVQFFKSNSVHGLFESLLNDPNAEVREAAAKVVCKVRSYFGENLFKNIDKNINNKDILSKLNEGFEGDENLAKSRSKDNKDLSSKKQRTQSKPKNMKNQEEQEVSKKIYVIKSSSKAGQDFDSVDITEEINKNMKKLNDSANWQNRKQAAEKLIRYFSHLEKQNSNAKITSSVMHDFLGVLRSRISDPNKQLIKIFVQLVGEVFRCLSEKQAKMQAKTYIQDLMEVYADKNDQNKKEIDKTFDRITVTLGSQATISNFGQLLSQQSSTAGSANQMASVVKQRTLEYLSNADFFVERLENIQSNSLKQFKQFPKVVLIGLCDKSKQLRSISERVFKLLNEKIGIQVFKNMIHSKVFSQGKLAAFKNDLTTFLDKFEGIGQHEQPSMISNGSNLSLLNDLSNKRSPALSKGKVNDLSVNNRRKMSNVSIASNNSLCNSRSKPKNSSVLANCEDSNQNYMSNLSFYLKDNASIDRNSLPVIQGSQPFAPLQFLTAQRIVRQQSHINLSQNLHPINGELSLKSVLSVSVNNNELYVPMYSSSYSKVIEAVNKLIKLCRDIAYVQAIRQIGDLLLKWVTVRLYGGNVAVMGVIELVCPVLSVLEKKKVVWGDAEVDKGVFLMREYLVTLYFATLGNTQSVDSCFDIIKNMFRLVISLSSGERVIRKLLNQLKQDPSQFHRHLSAASSRSNVPFTKFYKRQIVMLCSSFIQYFSNDTLLQEAANIPDLSQDAEFGRLLGNKFCDTVLKDFGFKTAEGKTYGPSTVVVGVNLQKSFINAANDKNTSISNDLGSPRNASSTLMAGMKSDQKDQKCKKVTPQKRNLNQSHFPPPSPVAKPKAATQTQLSLDTSSNMTQNNIRKQSTSLTQSAFYKQQKITDPSSLQSYIISPSAYPVPNTHNPLGSNLLKLYPYNESSIHFFTTLFLPSNSSNPKIASQLSTHSNTIFSHLFQSMQRMLQPQSRQHQHPDRPLLLLPLIQHAIKCSTMFTNVNADLVQKSIRYVIQQLVFEDENRTAIEQKYKARGIADYKADGFVKAVNGIILRLLDNSQPLFIVNVLLFHMIELMLEEGIPIYNNGMPTVNKGKKVGLLIRCLVRATNTYFSPTVAKQKQKQYRQLYNIDENPSCLKPAQVQKFVTLCYSYAKILQIHDLSQFQAKQSGKQTNSNTNNNNTEEHIVLCLCKIMRVLGKKGLLIKGYEAVIRDNKVDEDRVVGDFVMIVTGVNTNQLDQGCNILGTSNYQHQTCTNLIDEELKKIIQQLSKAKTFSEGIKSLKVYIHQQNGSKFDYRSAFAKMNFETAFIDKVGEQLAKLNNPMESSVGRSINPDIQNKLERLKMKLECINNEHSKSNTSKNSSQIDPSLSSKPAAHQQSSSSTYHPSNQSSLLSGCQTPKSGTQFFNPLSSGMGGMTPSTSSTTYMAQTTLNTQNDLKRKIEQMKNKVTMSTTNHNNNSSGFNYGNNTSGVHHVSTSTNKIR